MSVIAWIAIGGIAGRIGSLLVNRTGEGVFLDVVGGVIGGRIFAMLGSTGVTGFNLWSSFVAVVGAVAVLTVKHALVGPRRLT
jgi:uncharacterized membrane protein YeaQ/YmgE (transglycosylase-associated protein family)